MDVEIRLYKLYDADLLSLVMAGYSISAMMNDAISAYANGRAFHIYQDEIHDTDFNDMKTYHTRFSVNKSDEKTIYMLKNIKHRCRNMFCKAVLRDALIQQNLTVFFAKEAAQYLTPLQGINAANRNVQMFSGTVPVSSYKTASRKLVFAGKEVTVPQPKSNPFAGSVAAYDPLQFMPKSTNVIQPVTPSITPAPLPVAQQPYPIITPPVQVVESPVETTPVQKDTSTAQNIEEQHIVEQTSISKTENNNVSPVVSDLSAFDALDKLMGNSFD